MSSKIEQLLKKAKQIIPNYICLDGDRMKEVENALDITLPLDFKEINKKFSYESFPWDFRGFYADKKAQECVTNATLRLRKCCNFPKNALFLYEDDAGAIILEIIDADHSKISWMSIEDLDNFCEGMPLAYNPTIFPSFTDFFEYLIKQEEGERKIITS